MNRTAAFTPGGVAAVRIDDTSGSPFSLAHLHCYGAHRVCLELTSMGGAGAMIDLFDVQVISDGLSSTIGLNITSTGPAETLDFRLHDSVFNRTFLGVLLDRRIGYAPTSRIERCVFDRALTAI